MADSFTDERGSIEDLLVTPLDSVTKIFTRAGAIRGNHVHLRTTQWTYVVWGILTVVTREPGASALVTRTHGQGYLFCENPGVAHAWRAVEDTVVLVFTRGPRSGGDYEKDTCRLTGADRLIP